MDNNAAKTKLPTKYKVKLSAIASKVIDLLKTKGCVSFTKSFPICSEPMMMKGIKGGKLTLEKVNASTLFKLRSAAKPITKTV